MGALIVVVLVAALIVIHTDWFRNFVREQIISATEEATGGKVEIASFTFDVSHLREGRDYGFCDSRNRTHRERAAGPHRAGRIGS